MTSAPSTIVCAVDGSPESAELVRVGAGLAEVLGAGLEIGSRGLGPLNDGLLGSIARRLLRAARRPILVFPATSIL